MFIFLSEDGRGIRWYCAGQVGVIVNSMAKKLQRMFIITSFFAV